MRSKLQDGNVAAAVRIGHLIGGRSARLGERRVAGLVRQAVVMSRFHVLEQADAAGLDRVTLAARGADAVLKMILLDGFFHADPHPGNVFFLPDNRVVFVDFGMVGRLSPPRREELADLLMAEVEVRIKKRVKRHGKIEEMGELSIQFGSLEALNGLIDRLRG